MTRPAFTSAAPVRAPATWSVVACRLLCLAFAAAGVSVGAAVPDGSRDLPAACLVVALVLGVASRWALVLSRVQRKPAAPATLAGLRTWVAAAPTDADACIRADAAANLTRVAYLGDPCEDCGGTGRPTNSHHRCGSRCGTCLGIARI